VRIRRLLAVCGVLGVPLMGAAAVPAAASPQDAHSSCYGVLQGPSSGNLTKSGPTSVVKNPDGSFTLTYNFTTTRPDGTYRVQDCAFADLKGTGTFNPGDPVVGGTDHAVQVTGGRGTVAVTIHRYNVACVCDRLALSGAGFIDKSNFECGDHMPAGGPIGAAGFGLLGGVGLLAGSVLATRRRRSLAPSS
jgi:hypothetical protein